MILNLILVFFSKLQMNLFEDIRFKWIWFFHDNQF